MLEGAERSGGKPLSIAFAGAADLRASLAKRAFGARVTERRLGAVPAWLSAEAIAARAPGAHLVVRRLAPLLERLPRRGALARLPVWVRVRIDLKDPECAARGKEKLARLRGKARKAGFTFAYAGEEADYAHFYDRLHEPHVRDRHGDSTSIRSREETLARLRTGAWKLLTVRSGGMAVAAGTVAFEGGTARFWQLGVRDGDPALLAAGAADAVYAFVVSEAEARGCATLDLGSSRPFARDGVLEYKRMLGGYVFDGRDATIGSFELSVRRLEPGLADFLAENPMIARDPDGRCRLYGFVRDAGEAGERAAWWRARYCFKDTLGLRVFSLAGPAVEALDAS